MIQNTLKIGQKYFTVPRAREQTSERAQRGERTSEQLSEWPIAISITNVPISEKYPGVILRRIHAEKLAGYPRKMIIAGKRFQDFSHFTVFSLLSWDGQSCVCRSLATYFFFHLED